MLQIDSLLIEEFYKESTNFLIGARVQKIQQPTRRDIILFLRNNGESRKLYININPSFYHLCFMSKENELRRNIDIPKQPPMFCMLLRKHMEGAKIISVNKPAYERIIELSFENYNELGDRVEECLAIELMGKHSNVILYNSDNNIILGCAHNVGAEKSKERELAGGLPYIYPPKQNKKNINETRYNHFKSSILKSNESIKKTISDRYYGLSQILVEEICSSKNIDANNMISILSEQDIQVLFVALQEFFDATHIYTTDDDFTRYSCINNLGKNYQNINTLIDDYYAHNIEQCILTSLKSSMLVRLNKDLKKQINVLKNQQKQLDKREKADIYLKKGNLLMANIYNINTSLNSVDLIDYETNKSIHIEIDNNLTVVENANKYFGMYNKAKKAWQVAEEMSKVSISEIKYLEQLIYDIETSTSVEELKEASSDLIVNNEQTKKKQDSTFTLDKRIIDGFSVYIGKNNKQNDYLYSKLSSSEDLWFHTLNTPGSHIIVKSQNSKQKINDATILKIAELAKLYSSAKNSTKVPVVYTQRKYIKRPNNTKSGFVVYRNETEIVVE